MPWEWSSVFALQCPFVCEFDLSQNTPATLWETLVETEPHIADINTFAFNTHIQLFSHTPIPKSIFYTKSVFRNVSPIMEISGLSILKISIVNKKQNKKNFPCFRELKMLISDFIHFAFFCFWGSIFEPHQSVSWVFFCSPLPLPSSWKVCYSD